MPLIRPIQRAGMADRLNSCMRTGWKYGFGTSLLMPPSCCSSRRGASISNAGAFLEIRIPQAGSVISPGESFSTESRQAAPMNCSSKPESPPMTPKMREPGFPRPGCRPTPTHNFSRTQHALSFSKMRSQISQPGTQSTPRKIRRNRRENMAQDEPGRATGRRRHCASPGHRGHRQGRFDNLGAPNLVRFFLVYGERFAFLAHH